LESPTTAGFQKTDLGVSSTFGAGNTQIGFIIRIAETKVKIAEISSAILTFVFLWRQYFCLLNFIY
jgi:hypothetical protein